MIALRTLIASLLLTGWSVMPAAAQDDAALVRVVDVGQGLCVIVVTPDRHSMVYDAGGALCPDAVQEMIPDGDIDLLVFSHSDADHIGAGRAILQRNRVHRILHPGDARSGQTLAELREAIDAEPDVEVFDLSSTPLEFGHVFQIGSGASAIFVAGWADGHDSEGPDDPTLSGGPLNNALSIVIRFEYGGHSVLLSGDTVGRAASDQGKAGCRYAERYMVENQNAVPIDSDVLIGQHHGADNASSICFLRAVSPDYVVFSAGHNGTYVHPRASAAFRVMSVGIPADHIFRTDYRDNQGAPEWVYGALRGCSDPAGDDDVDIRLPRDESEPIRISYRYGTRGCKASQAP